MQGPGAGRIILLFLYRIVQFRSLFMSLLLSTAPAPAFHGDFGQSKISGEPVSLTGAAAQGRSGARLHLTGANHVNGNSHVKGNVKGNSQRKLFLSARNVLSPLFARLRLWRDAFAIALGSAHIVNPARCRRAHIARRAAGLRPISCRTVVLDRDLHLLALDLTVRDCQVAAPGFGLGQAFAGELCRTVVFGATPAVNPRRTISFARAQQLEDAGLAKLQHQEVRCGRSD